MVIQIAVECSTAVHWKLSVNTYLNFILRFEVYVKFELSGVGGKGCNYPRGNYPEWIFFRGNCLGAIDVSRICQGDNFPRALILGGSCPGRNCLRKNCSRWELSTG